MAHFIYEYSDNLPKELLDLAGLMEKMHQVAADSGIFPLSGIRSRAMCCEEFRVGDGNPDNGFVNLSIKVGRGRDEYTRHNIAETFFALMVDHLQPILQRQGLSISLEMRELEVRVKFNHKNI